MSLTLRLNPDHADFISGELDIRSFVVHIGHTWEGPTNVPSRGFLATGGHPGGGSKNCLTVAGKPVTLARDNWLTFRLDYRSQIADLVRKGYLLATLEDGTVLTADQCAMDAWERSTALWSDLEATNDPPGVGDGVSVLGASQIRATLVEDANLGEVTVTSWVYDGENWFVARTDDLTFNTSIVIDHPNPEHPDAAVFVQLSSYTSGTWTCNVKVTKT